jgi:hypothetical protein
MGTASVSKLVVLCLTVCRGSPRGEAWRGPLAVGRLG